MLNIKISEQNVEKITISNVEGKLITEQMKVHSNAQFDLSAVENGIYFITFEINGKIFTTKIIKK